MSDVRLSLNESVDLVLVETALKGSRMQILKISEGFEPMARRRCGGSIMVTLSVLGLLSVELGIYITFSWSLSL